VHRHGAMGRAGPLHRTALSRCNADVSERVGVRHAGGPHRSPIHRSLTPSLLLLLFLFSQPARAVEAVARARACLAPVAAARREEEEVLTEVLRRANEMLALGSCRGR
jgi:hypothetical protein